MGIYIGSAPGLRVSVKRNNEGIDFVWLGMAMSVFCGTITGSGRLLAELVWGEGNV